MDNTNNATTNQLNDFILMVIQTNGIDYVAINYIALRNDYYASRYPV